MALLTKYGGVVLASDTKAFAVEGSSNHTQGRDSVAPLLGERVAFRVEELKPNWPRWNEGSPSSRRD